MAFIPEEWTFIRQSLEEINIKGKDAKGLASLQIKVEQEFQKTVTKKEKELAKAMKSSK